MSAYTTKLLSTAVRLRGSVARFARDERGSATYFSISMLMMMLVVGGISVDLMQNEMTRTRVQNTLDRAVLAAADLDQTLEPADVVQDYFNKAGMGEYLTSVGVDEGLNYRTVTARADASTRTRFMHAMGVPELAAPARSTAEERISNVEISLVLDISGSMATDSKMQNLQDAADTFIDTVLRPETEDLISINLVPYSEHVNAGRDIFDELRTYDHYHNYSHCIEFQDNQYLTTTFDVGAWYQQVQHFQWNFDGYSNVVEDTVCPQYSYEEVTLLSQDNNALKNQIGQMQPRAGTAIHAGMKWAVSTLDPSFKPIVQALALQNKVDSDFTTRPASFDDPETLKTVVLMTDGQNSWSNRINTQVYRNTNHAWHWHNYNFNWYLQNYVPWNQRSNWYWQKRSASQGDTLLDHICEAAKTKGIVIWTIGFEVEDHGADVMQACASSPSHFFRVEGVEISEAFEAIAKQINQLRLTQ